MHGFSAMQEVINTAIEQAGGKKVTRLVVEIGQLRAIPQDEVEFAFQKLSEGTVLEGADLVVEEKKGEYKCECGETGEVDVIPFKCPKCGAYVEITSGKECRVKRIE